MLNIVHPEVEKYLDSILPQRSKILMEMEAKALKEGFPLVGPQVGALLKLLATAIGAKYVFELGSGFGYSGLWIAEGIPAEGRIVLTDSDEKNKAQAEEYFRKAGMSNKMRFHSGSAVELLKSKRGPFDMIFNDVDKEDYPQIIDIAYKRLRPGGILVTDNTLWYGHILENEPDVLSKSIIEHNRILGEHKGFFTVQIPLRDGVSVSLKI